MCGVWREVETVVAVAQHLLLPSLGLSGCWRRLCWGRESPWCHACVFVPPLPGSAPHIAVPPKLARLLTWLVPSPSLPPHIDVPPPLAPHMAVSPASGSCWPGPSRLWPCLGFKAHCGGSSSGRAVLALEAARSIRLQGFGALVVLLHPWTWGPVSPCTVAAMQLDQELPQHTCNPLVLGAWAHAYPGGWGFQKIVSVRNNSTAVLKRAMSLYAGMCSDNCNKLR